MGCNNVTPLSNDNDTLSFEHKHNDEARGEGTHSPNVSVHEKHTVVPGQIMSAGHLDSQLIPYVPHHIQQRFDLSSPNYNPVIQPGFVSSDAAVALIDISGFTAMTQSLQHKQKAGAEIMVNNLNAYFGKILNTVEQNGGVCEVFAGDAVIVVWDTATYPTATKSHLLQRCCHACLEIQRLYSQHKAIGVDDLEMSVHIGIDCGTVNGMALGGYQSSWMWLVVGDAICGLEAVVSSAGSTEVGLSQRAAALAIENHLFQPIQKRGIFLVPSDLKLSAEDCSVLTGTVSPSYTDICEEAKAFVEPALLERLQGNSSSWVAELRTVVTVFITLLKVPADTSKAVQVLQRLVNTVQRLTVAQEGAILNKLADEKGCTILVAFGFPRSHEDDILRGVALGVGVVTHPDMSGIVEQVAIGIAVGDTICGAVGFPHFKSFTVIGDAVNTSARLMAAAGGGRLYVSDGIRQNHKASDIAFVEDTVHMKGKGTVLVHRVIIGGGTIPGEGVSQEKLPVVTSRSNTAATVTTNYQQKSMLQLPPTFDVRSEEVNATVASIKDHMSQRNILKPLCILLKGDDGSGKSQYLRAIIHQMESQVILLSTSANRINATVAFGVFKPILLGIFDIFHASTQDRESVITKYSSRLDTSLQPFIALLNSLLGTALPETPEIEAQTVATRHAIKATLIEAIITDWQKGLDAKASDNHGGGGHRLSTGRSITSSIGTPLAKWKMIAVDNFHFVDDHSLSLLQRVCTINGIITVITSNADPKEDFAALCFVVPIEPLTLNQTRKLACHHVQCQSITDDLVAFLYRNCGGNATMLEGILDIFTREGDHTQLIGGILSWHPLVLNNLSQVSVPSQISGMIRSRIDRLTFQKQFILRVGSVVGNTFSIAELYAAQPEWKTDNNLEKHLEELVDGDFLIHVNTSVDDRDAEVGEQLWASEIAYRTEMDYMKDQKWFQFKQSLADQILYNSILEEQKQKLHNALAIYYLESEDNTVASLLQASRHLMNATEAVQDNLDSTLTLLDYLKSSANRLDTEKRELEVAAQLYTAGIGLISKVREHCLNDQSVQSAGEAAEVLDTMEFNILHDHSVLISVGDKFNDQLVQNLKRMEQLINTVNPGHAKLHTYLTMRWAMSIIKGFGDPLQIGKQLLEHADDMPQRYAAKYLHCGALTNTCRFVDASALARELAFDEAALEFPNALAAWIGHPIGVGAALGIRSAWLIGEYRAVSALYSRAQERVAEDKHINTHLHWHCWIMWVMWFSGNHSTLKSHIDQCNAFLNKLPDKRTCKEFVNFVSMYQGWFEYHQAPSPEKAQAMWHKVQNIVSPNTIFLLLAVDCMMSSHCYDQLITMLPTMIDKKGSDMLLPELKRQHGMATISRHTQYHSLTKTSNTYPIPTPATRIPAENKGTPKNDYFEDTLQIFQTVNTILWSGISDSQRVGAKSLELRILSSLLEVHQIWGSDWSGRGGTPTHTDGGGGEGGTTVTGFTTCSEHSRQNVKYRTQQLFEALYHPQEDSEPTLTMARTRLLNEVILENTPTTTTTPTAAPFAPPLCAV